MAPSGPKTRRQKVAAPVRVHGPLGEEEIYVAVGAGGGDVREGAAAEPDPEEVTEAATLAQTLADHGHLAFDPEAPPPGATHELETDDEGRKHLTRKKFAAIALGPR